MGQSIDVDDLLRGLSGYSTAERRKVLDVLARARKPVTARQIHSLMGRGACNIATIHRTLNHLQKSSLVRSISFDGISRWFDLWDNQNHHHYAFCTSCSRIDEIPLCQIDSFARYASRAKGYEVQSHSLELFGRCPGCRKKNRKRRGL